VHRRRRIARGQLFEALAALRGVEPVVRHRLQRVDALAVPVGVEVAREFGDDGARHEQVEVDEVGLRAAQEVVVGQVAPARDGKGAVGDEELVVHALVEAAEVGGELPQGRQRRIAPVGEGIEEPDLDPGIGGQTEQRFVESRGIEIVQKQPHANAARGRIAQRAQHQPAGGVVGDQVGLQIDGRSGAGDELDPRRERVVRHRNRTHRRALGRDREFARERRQRRIGRRGDARRWRPLDVAWQAGAAAQERQEENTLRSQRARCARSHGVRPAAPSVCRW
jgi:hypothetical protein